jgi:hypothetical protein
MGASMIAPIAERDAAALAYVRELTRDTLEWQPVATVDHHAAFRAEARGWLEIRKGKTGVLWARMTDAGLAVGL